MAKSHGERVTRGRSTPTYCSEEQPITPQCFASPTGCNNCFRKDRYGYMFDKTMKQYHRCGACHTVAYCDKICQAEHWAKVHRKHCNRLNGAKMVRKHNQKTCESCQKTKRDQNSKSQSVNHPEANCHIPQLQKAMKALLGSSMGYHKGDAKCKSNKTYAGQLPFTLGEVSGIFREQAYGRALAHAIKIIYTIFGKSNGEDVRSVLRWAKLYNTLILMRTRLWVEELTIGNPTDTVIIVAPGFNLLELQELLGQLCKTRTLKVWEEAATCAFYLMSKIEHLMRPMEMKVEALTSHKWLPFQQQVTYCKETVRQLNKQDQLSWLIWPCRRSDKLTLESTSLNLLQTTTIETWKPTKEIKKAIKEFFSKARTCQNCLRCSPYTHRCTRCKSAQYCTKSCQEEDLRAHKESCLLWEKSKTNKIPGRSEQQRRLKAIFEIAYDH